MDKIVLITGATKGIGKALAKVFAKNGYSLILIARTLSELETLQADLKKNEGCESKILSLDLSQPDCVETILSTFQDDLPKIEILINNAGYGMMQKFTDMSYNDVNGILAVNINALTKLTYRILPFMLHKKSGKVLNVASTAAYSPGPFMTIYYASKAYVLTFSESLYEEYKSDGILISVLCPGLTKTAFQARARMEHSRFVKGAIPSMSAEQVAEIAYQGLIKNKRVIVPGIFNKIIIIFMQMMPNFILAKLIARLGKPEK